MHLRNRMAAEWVVALRLLFKMEESTANSLDNGIIPIEAIVPGINNFLSQLFLAQTLHIDKKKVILLITHVVVVTHSLFINFMAIGRAHRLLSRLFREFDPSTM